MAVSSKTSKLKKNENVKLFFLKTSNFILENVKGEKDKIINPKRQTGNPHKRQIPAINSTKSSITMSVIPFDDIVNGATVRVVKLDDVQYLSIRDVIMCVCEKENKQASQIWDRLSEDQKTEVLTFVTNHKFPGPGQKEQPVITFQGAMKLLMILPGEKAKKHRSAMAGILHRYYAGDGSLVEEIEVNATSTNALAQLARGSLVAPNESAVVSMDRDQTVGSGLETLMMVDAKVDKVDVKMDMVDFKMDKIGAAAVGTNEELYKLNEELHFCRNKMEKQTAAVAYLNNTIRIKDAEIRAKDEQLRAKDAELRAKDAELAKLQDNYAALKALEGAVSAMATKLDTAIQVFF